MAEKVDLKEGVKPVTGAPSSFGRGTAVRQLDDEGRIKTVRTSGAPLDTTNVKTPQEAANPERIGDYYYDSAKNLQVWENSPTDLLQKYRLAIGGTEKPADLLSPSGEALSMLGPAVGAGVTAGAIAGGPVGVAVGAVAGLIGGLTNFNNAREEALKRWQEENVKYDSAVEFYKDDDGSVKYKVDYQKMGTGGPRSGERVKEAQNRETQVSLGDDGRLKVRVSPIFASTARFQEMMDFISTNYGDLSKDTENLDQILTEIKDGIDGEAKDYISNMRLYADFAQKFQNASPETIVSSYTTEMAGYVDPAKMKDFQMTVLGDDDKVATRSAAEFFDSVLSMDKTGRNNLATKLNDIVYGESNNYSDDQRAIAYGELQAMYTASANPEEFENSKYQGMMDADGFVSFMNSFSPLGLNGGDVLKFLSGGAYSKQEMLNPDEWAQFFGGAAGIGAGFGIWKGGTSLVEAGLKRLPGTAALFNASISGKGTEAMAWIAQNTGNTSVLAKAWGAEAAFKMIKLGIFDAALAGSQTAVSNEDFWSNFGQDFARDAVLEALFSYYDMVAFKQATTESVVRVYEDPKTGNMVPVRVPEGETIPEQIILTGDGTPVDETFTSVGLSGKPEEFVRSGNGTSVYKLKGKANIAKTRTGDVVGIYEDPNVSQIMLNGKTYTISHTSSGEGPVLLESGDIGIDEFPVMSSGVINVTPSSDADKISKIMAKMNLPANTKTWEVPESSANAAMAAGKIAAVQNTKVGMKIYKQLFNKNGVLDVANNMALAKDGDLNSWRNAQEYFVSVQNNAMRNLNDIQNGVYFKEAATEWAKTVELMGKFNYEYKYKPKTDGAYINAILNIERAELLNQNRAEDDTTDYVAKALEVYGDVLAEMPTDRGELLQNWVQQGKKWLKTFNESVKKSGKVDMEKLENITDTDIDSEIGWFPVWGKRTKYKGLLDSFRGITKERNPYKSWLRDGEWVPADQLGDPWDNMNRYMGFVANNMGLNDMTEQAATVYDRAGLLVDNTPTDATIRKRKLESIKNKDELNKKLDEMIADVKKETEERTLTPAEYSDTMTKIYEESAIPEVADALANLGDSPVSSLKESEGHSLADTNMEVDGADYASDVAKNLHGEPYNPGYEKFIQENLAKNELDNFKKAGAMAIEQTLITPGGPIDDINQQIRSGTMSASDIPKELEKKLDVETLARNWYGMRTEDLMFSDVDYEELLTDFAKEAMGIDLQKDTKFRKVLKENAGKNAKSIERIIADYLKPKIVKEATSLFKDGFYKTKNNVIVYRSLSKDGNFVGDGDVSWVDQSSGEYSDPGYAFVTLDISKVLENERLSGTGDNVILRVHVPAGEPIFAFNSGVEVDQKYLPPMVDSSLISSGHRAGGEMALAPSKGFFKKSQEVDASGNEIIDVYIGKNREDGEQYYDSLESVKREAYGKAQEEKEERQWEDFWKNAPAKTRKDIRNELEKTSLQTGYGISDTRARLNAMLPGFDIIEWGLLGRDHVNGLVPGGLYAGKENIGVKAYIVPISDLLDMFQIGTVWAPSDFDWAAKELPYRFLKHINTEGEGGIIPFTLSKKTGDDGSRGVLFDPRGGHSMGSEHSKDGHLIAYLQKLASEGIKNVPIAISYQKDTIPDDATISNYLKDAVERGAEKRRNKTLPDKNGNNSTISLENISKYLQTRGEQSVRKTLKKVFGANDENIDLIISEARSPLSSDYIDITADVQQAFSENGKIPFFHGQRSPLGSIEYNEPDSVPSDIYEGAGDAYWLAPNSSYTDEYGKNKIMGTIPVKYFMSDKEKHDEIMKIYDRLSKLETKMKEALDKSGLEIAKDANLTNATLSRIEEAERKGLSENLESLYPGETDKAKKILRGALTKKELDEYNELSQIFDIGKVSGNGIIEVDKYSIKSYRALAERLKKPIIDISNDDFADGTAFFYYKGIDPEFDEKTGKQLEIQARGTPMWSESVAQEELQTWLENNTIGDLLDRVQEVSPTTADLVSDIKETTIFDSDLQTIADDAYNLFNTLANTIRGMYPGLAHLLTVLKNRAWTTKLTDYDINTKLSDMDIDYTRFLNGTEGVSLLEELGIENPDYITPEEKQAWADIDPTNPANVPTEPRFVQPRRKVTYEDYQKGLQADPDMPARIQNSYRAAMANRLIKEATRVVALAEGYLSEYGYGADWQSYLNTSLIPDLQNAINQNMLPDEFSSFVQARIAQAMQDVAPYQSPELLLKSRLEGVAQEWRDWALKHIKANRMTYDELRKFVNSHNLELPNDKRSYPDKIKHTLWEMVQNNKRLPEIEGINPTAISKEMDKKLFYQMLDDTPLFQSIVKDKNELLDLVALERNKETTDSFTMGAAAIAAGLGGRYPMTWFKNGKPYTRFIKYDTKGHLLIAEQTTKALNDKELLKEDGLISKAATFVANDFRLLTTGWDPSRSLPNLARDTGRSFTIGRRFINAKEMLKSSIDAGSYTKKQRKILEKAIDNAANTAANSSYNSAYRTSSGTMKDITKDYLSRSGANPMKRFFYNIVHDKRSILEWPMEFVEGYSRRANARSLAAVQLRKDQKAGASFKTQLKNAATASEWAGREYTANFQRKGELIGRTSKYIAYQSSAYAGFDSMMRAFINDPKLVARNFAAFVLAYLVLLADTLSREETRKQYYRLSDYDRENQIVIGMGDSILTIPMDQELAGLLFPYRRIMETLNGTDPVSFFEFVWGSLTAALPSDLSGFSEGDGFNLSRGLEKLTSQNMPNLLTGIVEASTGYDLYYGTQTSVSKETLKDYGIYAPEPGDYTTTGKDSATLRGVANATGIPQWQLQVMLDNYGGNVGKYVLNTLDKLSGATKDQQGGKDFANTVFNSFTGLDQDAASNAFYAGITQLKDEKNKLIQKIANYNEDLKTASGDAKIELQNKISQAKSDYGTKVGDFVDKYISAYEITGGLPKSQAQQIYFLFRLDDDDTLYQSGSVEEYYNNQAVQQFKNQATAMSAPILDKYYNNRLGNIYQDSEGVWRRYLSSGAQAMKNSVYGLGEQQKVDLLNILEGKNSNLGTLRTQIKNARNQAFEAKDWDTRDALAYELDKQILQAISPYIEQYGAENVLGNTDVLEYLSEWFIVPDDFIRSKKGKYVSLGNNASTQKAFVQPFIKYIFGLPTNFSSYNDAKITPTELGGQ